jgi:hypothetical protein
MTTFFCFFLPDEQIASILDNARPKLPPDIEHDSHSDLWETRRERLTEEYGRQKLNCIFGPQAKPRIHIAEFEKVGELCTEFNMLVISPQNFRTLLVFCVLFFLCFFLFV